MDAPVMSHAEQAGEHLGYQRRACGLPASSDVLPVEGNSPCGEGFLPDPDHLGFKIKAICDALGRGANRSFRELGVTFSQLCLLTNLVAQGGHTTQRRLELLLGVSHPTVVGLVKRLEAKGYVTTFFSVEDARMKVVAITDEGRAATERAGRHRERSEAAMVCGLCDEDVGRLKELLDHVHANLLAMEVETKTGGPS